MTETEAKFKYWWRERLFDLALGIAPYSSLSHIPLMFHKVGDTATLIMVT